MYSRQLLGILVLSAPVPALATPLAPHTAVYDLSLAEQTREIVSAEGRIALELTQPECGVYALDYRFVARFAQESETILTDQRIVARESTDGRAFEYEAWTLVDGLEQAHVKGRAETDGDITRIAIELPAEREFEIAASRFPLGHTATLIRAAQSGTTFAQTPLYDGDEDGDKGLSTSAILLPLPEESGAGHPETASLNGWRVDESYFNDDADADGLPIFQTRYTLFENGVSDDLFMDFGEYALEGHLSEITMGAAPEGCPG